MYAFSTTKTKTYFCFSSFGIYFFRFGILFRSSIARSAAIECTINFAAFSIHQTVYTSSTLAVTFAFFIRLSFNKSCGTSHWTVKYDYIEFFVRESLWRFFSLSSSTKRYRTRTMRIDNKKKKHDFAPVDFDRWKK